MKKFYKSWMFLTTIGTMLLFIPIGYLMMMSEKHSLVWRFGGLARDGGVMWTAIFLLMGVSNFFGSRFTLPRKYDFITSSLPVFMILGVMLICIATGVGAVVLTSQSPWLLVELFTGIGLIIALLMLGSFLRGMADDERQSRELMEEVHQHQG